ncbi:hypothetical protein EV360DRAFT_70237 [Lentinula raphanica]|nr:hypothetical protein EV360DRAFT_70237 [Lentinula raphanica]
MTRTTTSRALAILFVGAAFSSGVLAAPTLPLTGTNLSSTEAQLLNGSLGQGSLSESQPAKLSHGVEDANVVSLGQVGVDRTFNDPKHDQDSWTGDDEDSIKIPVSFHAKEHRADLSKRGWPSTKLGGGSSSQKRADERDRLLPTQEEQEREERDRLKDQQKENRLRSEARRKKDWEEKQAEMEQRRDSKSSKQHNKAESPVARRAESEEIGDLSRGDGHLYQSSSAWSWSLDVGGLASKARREDEELQQSLLRQSEGNETVRKGEKITFQRSRVRQYVLHTTYAIMFKERSYVKRQVIFQNFILDSRAVNKIERRCWWALKLKIGGYLT